MSATNINAAGLVGKRAAILDSDGTKLLPEMERVFAEQGRVEVVLSGFEHITSHFLSSSWGSFLLAAPTLDEAERRYQNTIFLYDGPTRSLRHMIYQLGRQALQLQERRAFQNVA